MRRTIAIRCVDAQLAGIKTDDRLIEINGQNIQNLDHDSVTQRIRAVKYPEPLELLVADVPTYEYYKQNRKLINRGLNNVRIMPANSVMRSSSPGSSHRCKYSHRSVLAERRRRPPPSSQ